MLETGEQTLSGEGRGGGVWSEGGPGGCLLRSGSDSSELVPEAGRHEAFHLVCEESQGCKERAEELRRGNEKTKQEVNS